jgi:hypothetical protein
MYPYTHELSRITGPFWLYKVEDDHPVYMRALMNN